MKKNFDRILKQALSPTEEPDVWLNQNILYQAEEMVNMAKKAKKKKGRFSAAVAAGLRLPAGDRAVCFRRTRHLCPAGPDRPAGSGSSAVPPRETGGAG